VALPSTTAARNFQVGFRPVTPYIEGYQVDRRTAILVMLRDTKESDMWLFAGRYGQFGPVICAIAAAALSIGSIFLVGAVRLIRKSDLACLLVTASAAVAFGYSSGFSEPVFLGGHLNAGAALIIAALGTLFGIGGEILIRRLRLVRTLLLIAGAGLLFGDVAGWIHRSAGPSKYGYSIGRLASHPHSPRISGSFW
jgi:hypothetical protein